MRVGLLLGTEPPPADLLDALRAHLAADERACAVVLDVPPAMAAPLAHHLQLTDAHRALVLLAPAGTATLDDAGWGALGSLERVVAIDFDGSLLLRLDEAARQLDQGALGPAQAPIDEATAACDVDATASRAEVLARLGVLTRRLGDGPRAAALLDRALALHPTHGAALRERIELARVADDFALSAALRRRALPQAGSDEEKIGALGKVADDALEAAVDALRAALTMRPGDPSLLQRLRAVHEASGDFARAVDASVALAEASSIPTERARAFVSAAHLCAERARNVPRAVALYEAAIADDPAVPGAFEAIEAVLLADGDHRGAERAYVRQLERLEGAGARDAQSAILDKLARVRSDQLGDWQGAVHALDRRVAMDPGDVVVRERLAALLERHGEDALAVRCLELAVRAQPTRATTHHALHGIFARTDDVDRAYATSATLVHLGDATVDEQEIYRRFAPRVALQPTRGFDDALWGQLLVEEHDRDLQVVFDVVAPVAYAVRVDALKRKGQLPKLDAKTRQDVDQSTISAVRTVGWAARLLGVPTPNVHVRGDDVVGGLAFVLAPEPTVVLGQGVLSGRSVPELAFRTAWVLAHARLTGRALELHPSIEQLSQLVVGAVAIVLPDGAADESTRALAGALGQRLSSGQRDALERAVRALVSRGGRVDLVGWLRAVEIAAGRAALVACGDPSVAARMLSIDGRAVGGLTAADRVKDVLGWSVSSAHAAARRALGVALRGTLPKPAGTSGLPPELDVAIDLGE